MGVGPSGMGLRIGSVGKSVWGRDGGWGGVEARTFLWGGRGGGPFIWGYGWGPVRSSGGWGSITRCK